MIREDPFRLYSAFVLLMFVVIAALAAAIDPPATASTGSASCGSPSPEVPLSGRQC